MSLRVSRIELRSCSGVPAVRPVKIPNPPAFETAATSLGRPTHLRARTGECQLAGRTRSSERSWDAHHAALYDGDADAELLGEGGLDGPACGEEARRGQYVLGWSVHTLSSSSESVLSDLDSHGCGLEVWEGERGGIVG